MGFRKQTKGLRNYFDGAAAPLPLSSVWLDCSTPLPLQQVDVMAIIHAFQPSTQSHPQIKRVFGSASGVDPLRLKKKTRKNCSTWNKTSAEKHAQPQTIAPIYENKPRHPTPRSPCSVSTQKPPIHKMNTAQAIALSSRNAGRSSVSLQGCSSRLLIASGEEGIHYVALMLGHRFTNSSADQDLYSRAGERIYYGTHGLANPKTAGRNARAMRRLASI